MDYINQFVTFFFTPIGLLTTSFSAFVLIQPASIRSRLQWWIITLLGFSASLGKYANEFGVTSPPLAFPLEDIREMGRPLAVLFLITCASLAFRSRRGWRKKLFPKPILYLLLFQAVIVWKTILYGGSLTFAILTLVIYSTIILSISLGVSQWLQNDQDLERAFQAIAFVFVIFATANLYQALIDVDAIRFIHGWFSGTTGNPHHAALLITTSLPCIIFFYNSNQNKLYSNIWLIILGLCIFGLVITASRTGLISSFVAILILFRRKRKRLIVISIALIILWLLISQFIQPIGDLSTFSATTDKIAKFQNTRSVVWQALWTSFLQHPFLGTPLQGDRFSGYGESSWLGAAAATGLVGLIPLLMSGFECLKMMWNLDQLSHRYPQNYWKYSVVISGLGGILTGSLAEAYLLGNLTFVLLGFFLYLTLGTYLLEQSQRLNSLVKNLDISSSNIASHNTVWNR